MEIDRLQLKTLIKICFIEKLCSQWTIIAIVWPKWRDKMKGCTITKSNKYWQMVKLGKITCQVLPPSGSMVPRYNLQHLVLKIHKKANNSTHGSLMLHNDSKVWHFTYISQNTSYHLSLASPLWHFTDQRDISSTHIHLKPGCSSCSIMLCLLLWLLMNHYNKDPTVWLDGARPANTCIPPSFGWMVPTQLCSGLSLW
jgi:hypothetical protein